MVCHFEQAMNAALFSRQIFLPCIAAQDDFAVLPDAGKQRVNLMPVHILNFINDDHAIIKGDATDE